MKYFKKPAHNKSKSEGKGVEPASFQKQADFPLTTFKLLRTVPHIPTIVYGYRSRGKNTPKLKSYGISAGANAALLGGITYAAAPKIFEELLKEIKTRTHDEAIYNEFKTLLEVNGGKIRLGAAASAALFGLGMGAMDQAFGRALHQMTKQDPGSMKKEATAVKAIKRFAQEVLLPKLLKYKAFKAIKGVDDTGKMFYPKLRKAYLASLLFPIPGVAEPVGAAYWLSTLGTHAYFKSPVVKKIIDKFPKLASIYTPGNICLKKFAGSQQVEYKEVGKKLYRIIHSTQPFEGAKQPDLNAKYFFRKDEIKDFKTKGTILKQLHREKMKFFKKQASTKGQYEPDQSAIEAASRYVKNNDKVLKRKALRRGHYLRNIMLGYLGGALAPVIAGDILQKPALPLISPLTAIMGVTTGNLVTLHKLKSFYRKELSQRGFKYDAKGHLKGMTNEAKKKYLSSIYRGGGRTSTFSKLAGFLGSTVNFVKEHPGFIPSMGVGATVNAGRVYHKNNTPEIRARKKKYGTKTNPTPIAGAAFLGALGGAALYEGFKDGKFIYNNAKKGGPGSWKDYFNQKYGGDFGKDYDKWWSDFESRYRQQSAGQTSASGESLGDLLKHFDVKKQNIKTKKDAKKAYWTAAKQAHPDKGGSGEKMKNINAAWEELKKRNWYSSLPQIIKVAMFKQWARQYSQENG